MTKNFQLFLDRMMAGMTRDIGIDLGTANTLVYLRGHGIVLNEPSVVAMNNETGETLAVGEEAKRMLGRTPANIVAHRPMKDGVIADFEVTYRMLDHFIGKVTSKFLLRKSVVVGIPSGVTEVERLAVLEASKKAGATHAYVIEEPMAAAIGADLPVEEPCGSMIVDIGGGTTEVAVISLGGIVNSRSIRVAGNELDESINTYVRRAYNLLIGDRTGETAKIQIGSAFPLQHELEMKVAGMDLLQGLPREATITSEEVRLAIAEPLNSIVEAVKITLEATPPELASDAIKNGITMAGGGALLRGIDRLISHETGIPVKIAKDPLACVVKGTGRVVEEMHMNSKFRDMLNKASRG